MTATPAERIRELTQHMLRKKYYVVLWHGKGVDITPHLPDHLQYMIALEKYGILFASGPLSGTMGDGMTVLRAGSIDDARAIAARDPFVVNNLRTFEIREWTVMEGSVGLTVNFSDQSVTLT